MWKFYISFYFWLLEIILYSIFFNLLYGLHQEKPCSSLWGKEIFTPLCGAHFCISTKSCVSSSFNWCYFVGDGSQGKSMREDWQFLKLNSPPGYQIFPALAADEDENSDENGRDDDAHDDEGNESGLVLQGQVMKKILSIRCGVRQGWERGVEQLWKWKQDFDWRYAVDMNLKSAHKFSVTENKDFTLTSLALTRPVRTSLSHTLNCKVLSNIIS